MIRKTYLHLTKTKKSISHFSSSNVQSQRKWNNLAPLFALSEGGTHCFLQHKANFVFNVVYKFMPTNLSLPLQFSANSFGVAQPKCTILRSQHLQQQAQAPVNSTALKNKLHSFSSRISATVLFGSTLKWSQILNRGAIWPFRMLVGNR